MRCLPEQDFYLIIGASIITVSIFAVAFDLLVTKLTTKKRGRKRNK
jgi:hypothetical protein